MKGGGVVGRGEVSGVGAVPPALDWKFSQVFGERAAGEEVQEVDIISAIEFDRTGDHLATGDRGGRVVLFERADTKDHGMSRSDLERMDNRISRHPEFSYKTEFQSHEPEFDYLKSLEIEEKINKIRWCQTANSTLFLLSTNDKTIKFWKIQEKKVKKISEMNVDPSKATGKGCVASSNVLNGSKPCVSNGGYPNKLSNSLINELSFPPGGVPSLHLPVVVSSHETSLVARCRRVYAHAHDYHINSISNNRTSLEFIMVLLPIVELHSVALRLKTEETDNTSYEMCGEVIVENGVFSEYMFKEDEESGNSETVLPDGTLNLMGPSRCIAGNGYVFCVHLKDKKSGLEVCNGFYNGPPLPEDYWFDNPLRAVIPGKHGSVVLHYSVFKVGVQASVKVKLLPQGDDQCSRKHLVYGTMYVRYVNYESKYPGEFSKKHYRSTLLYASPSNPKKVEESGQLIQLSRNVVGVPDFSELIIEAELWDTYYGVSETRAPDVKGFVSFIPEPKSSGPMTIHGTNCSIEVEVGWMRNTHKEYYDKATLARMSTKKLLSEIAALRKKGACT